MFPKSPLLDTAHIILSTDVYEIKILKACQLITLCIAEYDYHRPLLECSFPNLKFEISPRF